MCNVYGYSVSLMCGVLTPCNVRGTLTGYPCYRISSLRCIGVSLRLVVGSLFLTLCLRSAASSAVPVLFVKRCHPLLKPLSPILHCNVNTTTHHCFLCVAFDSLMYLHRDSRRDDTLGGEPSIFVLSRKKRTEGR